MWQRFAELAPKQHSSDAVCRRHADGKGYAQADTEPVDGIGKNSFAVIRDDQDYEDAAEKQPLNSGNRETEAQITTDKKKGCYEFDGGIHRRNWGAAIAALAAKDDPAQHRKVVVRLDGRAALGATGAGRDDRHTRGNPRDADVQKAADSQSDEKKHGNDHSFTVT